MLGFTELLTLTLSIFVSFAAAYVVAVEDRRRRAGEEARLVVSHGQLRTWFVAMAVAFLLLFLDQFARMLPPSPLVAGAAGAAVVAFYALMGFVAVDAVLTVTGENERRRRAKAATRARRDAAGGARARGR